jgi:hypothetical protein
MSYRKICDNCGVIDNKSIKQWYHVELRFNEVSGSGSSLKMERDFCSHKCVVEGTKEFEKES